MIYVRKFVGSGFGVADKSALPISDVGNLLAVFV